MVPAAAVIPSLRAFSYVAAVKMPVAVNEKSIYLEKIGAFIAGMPLYSTARYSIGVARPYAVYDGAGTMVFWGDR